jgi:hypothetical protein
VTDLGTSSPSGCCSRRSPGGPRSSSRCAPSRSPCCPASTRAGEPLCHRTAAFRTKWVLFIPSGSVRWRSGPGARPCSRRTSPACSCPATSRRITSSSGGSAPSPSASSARSTSCAPGRGFGPGAGGRAARLPRALRRQARHQGVRPAPRGRRVPAGTEGALVLHAADVDGPDLRTISALFGLSHGIVTQDSTRTWWPWSSARRRPDAPGRRAVLPPAPLDARGPRGASPVIRRR